MADSPPVFLSYTDWLAASISRYEEMARHVVRHKGEKGGVVEAAVRSALRAALPERFRIGTGFAITSSGKVSPQLDLVIYDAMYNAPVIMEGGVGLFPIECMYGFVEVKSKLDGKAIDLAMNSIQIVRSMAKEKRYVAYGTSKTEDGTPVVLAQEVATELAPRSFVFAVNSSFGNRKSLSTRLMQAAKKSGGHIHGLVILERDWFVYQKAKNPEHPKTPPSFVVAGKQAFARFCGRVLASVQSMQMAPAAMDNYLPSDAEQLSGLTASSLFGPRARPPA